MPTHKSITRPNTFGNEGRTILELIIYIGIAAILLLSNLILISNILRIRTRTMETQDLNYTMNTINLALTQDLRWAQDAVIQNSGNTLVITKGGNAIRYFRNNDALIKEAFGNTDRITPNNIQVTQVIFENLSPNPDLPSIRVTIKARGVTRTQNIPLETSTTVSKRTQHET